MPPRPFDLKGKKRVSGVGTGVNQRATHIAPVSLSTQGCAIPHTAHTRADTHKKKHT